MTFIHDVPGKIQWVWVAQGRPGADPIVEPSLHVTTTRNTSDSRPRLPDNNGLLISYYPNESI